MGEWGKLINKYEKNNAFENKNKFNKETEDENKVGYTDYESPMVFVYKYSLLKSHEKENLNVTSLLTFCL